MTAAPLPRPLPPQSAPSRTPRQISSFSIGHLAHIDIRVHLTFFLLVAVFALGSSGPGGPGVVGGLIWLVIVFSCVVVHEMAHSLVARSRGALVREIVLLPIGGVSRLENLPESPTDEFAIAIVGPVASVVLAGVAALVSLGLRRPLLPFDLYGGQLLARLVWFNLILGGFNLLPGFPLDGGRVFRALLERRYDLERATHLAARVGRGLAVVLVALGVFVNVWLVLIGVFVYFGASAEEAATVTHVRLRGASIANLMLVDPVVVTPTTSVADLQALVRRTAQRVFPIVGGQGYEGMVDARMATRSAPAHLASDIALQIAPVDLGADLEETASFVADTPTKAVAISAGGRIVGVLRVEEIEHLLTDGDRKAAQL